MSGEQSYFVLANVEKCTGCRACELACFAAHQKGTLKTVGTVTAPVVPNLYLAKTDLGTMPIQCHHCENAPCVQSCATGALIRKDGAVVINRRKCIGCKNCAIACPFGAIAMLGASEMAEISEVFGCCCGSVHHANKCDLCVGRDKPACVATCPNEALRLVDTAQEVSDKRSRAADAMGLVSDIVKQGRV
jgi:electron transport protein HydN